ncbi:MAG TPA: hypothetical protein VM452_12330 [Caulifigura sp.]|jgi:hypothetical protein|nr:hypothetical protein [Caulifigura sp.]
MLSLPASLACSAGHPLMLLGIFESPAVQLGIVAGVVLLAATVLLCWLAGNAQS